MDNANVLRAAFSIEHLRWLLLCLHQNEDEESVEQGSEEKNFQIKEENENI